MINISTLKRFACLTAMAAAIVMVGGSLTEVNAQRDPFKKAGWSITKKQPVAGSTTPKTPKVTTPVVYGVPAVEARIEYYKRLRDAAAANGSPVPKPTSVMTLNELAVTGIFKTPRGYAAMVEATPIKLSYTIYPGEKFFDGQLVAVEDNRLVFRKVTKVADGKFVASVENKPLRQYTMKAQVEGTAPTQPAETQTEVAKTTTAVVPASAPATAPGATNAKPGSNPFISPLDEMNNQSGKPDAGKDKAKKGDKKPPVKVAKNSGTK